MSKNVLISHRVFVEIELWWIVIGLEETLNAIKSNQIKSKRM